jgi:hypothetical protein
LPRGLEQASSYSTLARLRIRVNRGLLPRREYTNVDIWVAVVLVLHDLSQVNFKRQPAVRVFGGLADDFAVADPRESFDQFFRRHRPLHPRHRDKIEVSPQGSVQGDGVAAIDSNLDQGGQDGGMSGDRGFRLLAKGQAKSSACKSCVHNFGG